MTTPSIVPAYYTGMDNVFTKVVGVDRSGATRLIQGTVTVPSGTVAGTYIGLIPFNAGARFMLNDKSIYAGNFGAGTTVVDFGWVYDDNVTYTNDPDGFAANSTAAQSSGFVSLTTWAGHKLITQANGWLTAQIKTADADATADIIFSILQVYEGRRTH